MPAADTRTRLLDAAAKTLAERGFRDATVREICRRARANVAAVNYHFGSREALVREAVRWAHAQCDDPTERLLAQGDVPPPPAAVVIAALGNRILGSHEPWQTHLMLRGMLDPQPALDDLVREYVEPRLRVLERALAAEVPGADPRRLRVAALSVVAQFGWVRLASPIALRLLGEPGPVTTLRDDFVAHVARTTTAWLRADPGTLLPGSAPPPGSVPATAASPATHAPFDPHGRRRADEALPPAGSVPPARDGAPEPLRPGRTSGAARRPRKDRPSR